jgi:hypothetical protein
MRKFLQSIFTKPAVKLANRISSKPDKKRVDKALGKLYDQIKANEAKKGLLLPFNAGTDKFIIFSDQHKGARDGADVFAWAARNYLSALEYYNQNGYFHINLGDSEELWGKPFCFGKTAQ